jgi:hypothetical protein
MVAGDAARALGALGKRAGPSVGALVTTLSHEDPTSASTRRRPWRPSVRRRPGDNALAEALAIRFPAFRWAACEALAASAGRAVRSAAVNRRSGG